MQATDVDELRRLYEQIQRIINNDLFPEDATPADHEISIMIAYRLENLRIEREEEEERERLLQQISRHPTTPQPSPPFTPLIASPSEISAPNPSNVPPTETLIFHIQPEIREPMPPTQRVRYELCSCSSLCAQQ
jgi:hypothetical protein